MAYVGRRQIGELVGAFVGKFNGDDVLVSVFDLFLRRFQILTGQARRAAFVFKFHDGRLADRFDGFFRILFAGQLNDDAAGAFLLHQRFRQAHFIDTPFDDRDGAVQRVFRDRRIGRIFRFQDDMRAALQIQALFNRVGQRINEGQEHAQYNGDRPKKLYHITGPQQVSLLL